MPTVHELTDPYLGVFTAVPPVGAGICAVCHRPIRPQFATCRSCEITMGQVTHSLTLVVPISLYLGHQQLHHVLRGYKDPSVYRLTDRQRSLFEARVAAAVARFLGAHEPHINGAAGDSALADALVPVPSGKGRLGDPPIYKALRRVPGVRDRLRVALAPDQPIKHLKARDDGFRVIDSGLVGKKVVIVDDTFTSGAAVQSATSALTLAGVDVAAAVVVGRYVEISEEYEPSGDWWIDHRRTTPFSFATCAVE